jgi:murein L,D-transpeptidase YafK
MRCGVLRADLVVVSKKKREMVLLRGESVLRTYRIALGREPVGAKRAEGDGRTPEGRYTIDYRNAKSKCHLSLHISYPDAADVARAREAGVDAGGDIMIHGLQDGVRMEGDWTRGCIAVTDEEMDEIWGLVEEGTAIRIEE